MGAGQLREVLAFETREMVDDGAGNEVSGPWVEQCRAHAELKPLRGTETVMAARLSGRQPYLATVRYTGATALIAPDWRAVDVRTGREFNIRTAAAREKRDYIDMIVESGVAV